MTILTPIGLVTTIELHLHNSDLLTMADKINQSFAKYGLYPIVGVAAL
jgi:hypothetical protein